MKRNRNQLSLPPEREIIDLTADFQLSQDKDVNVDHKKNSEKINMLGEQVILRVLPKWNVRVVKVARCMKRLLTKQW